MSNRYTGEMLSPGTAKGRLLFLQSDFSLSEHGASRAGDVDQEIARFQHHMDGLTDELAGAVMALEAESAEVQAQILRAYLYLVKDPKFHQEVRYEIREAGLSAETAIESVLRRMIAVFEESSSQLLAERAADLRDIIARLSRRVNRQHREAFEALREDEAVILATRELLPSVVLEARNTGIVGFVVEKGTGLSHAVILAKSLGFPVLRIEALSLLQAAWNEEVLFDAVGNLVVAPGRELTVHPLEREAVLQVEDRGRLPVRLWVNVADPSQVTPKLLERVEGVGLYRTEVLFMEQAEDFPSEQQQYEVYGSLFAVCSPDHPVTIRTADIGGDKMLPYFPLGRQENPFLGVRANRVYREHPEIFITQMRAILRAGACGGELRIMYPMIGSREDLLFIERLLGEAIRSLRARRDLHQDRFKQGIMIEVPSAAWNCDELLGMVDFASVGTNDLLQYFFAVGRDDANVSQSHRTQDPVALRMLKRLADAADEVGKPLSICGEIASDPEVLPLLIGLGFKDLSIDIRSLPRVEEAASGLDLRQCRQLARDCLAAKTSREVAMLLSDWTLENGRGTARPAPRDQAPDSGGGDSLGISDSTAAPHRDNSSLFRAIVR